MRIKKDFIPFFLLVVVVLFFGLLAPASADFKKVNDSELARANASLTGKPATILCPDPEDAEHVCVAVPAEKDIVANEDSLSTVYEDYGYDWWKSLNVVGDVDYYEDVAVLSALTVESGRGDGSSWVTMGLGSQEVELESYDVDVTLGSEAASIAGQNQALGSLHLDGLTLKTNGSDYVRLTKVDGKVGLGVNVDTTIDRITLATLSWGDDNGCSHEDEDVHNTGNAGYVGLKNTIITGITASGSLSIDVSTDNRQDLSLTQAVHMGLDTMDVGITSLDTTVVLGDKKDFSGSKYTLGTLYMNNLNMNVSGHLNIYNPSGTEATTLALDLTIPWLSLETLSWGDPDGVGGNSAAGYVGLSNLAIHNLAITGRATVETKTVPSPDYTGGLPEGTVFVRLGFTELSVGMGSLDTGVALGSSKDNLNQVLGSVYLSRLNMDINGTVDIYKPSPSNQGIGLDLDLRVAMQPFTLSWGDADGIGAGTTAGFVGLRNLAIDGLRVKGPVSIEVATINSERIPTNQLEMIYNLYETHQMSRTFVHIGLGTGDANADPDLPGALVIDMISLEADVALGSDKTLTTATSQTLGSLYVSNMTAKVNGWVHIAAH